MSLKLLSLLIAMTFILFSCNQISQKDKTHKVLYKNIQTTKRRIILKETKPSIDTINANYFYNNLTTISLPFLPSSHISNSIITCKKAALPYTTIDEKNLIYIERQTYLDPIDSAYIVSKLIGLRPLVVNPSGGTSFGDFDCLLDSANCPNLEVCSKIGIACALKADSNYMCHIILSAKEWYENNIGILMLITPNGQILQWMFSDGVLTTGNPHGNIVRTFTILSQKRISIKEYAFGDNSEHYTFRANYKIGTKNFYLEKRKLSMLK